MHGALSCSVCACAGYTHVLWLHIGILMRLFAAQPRSIAWLLFPSQYLYGMVLVALYLIVWDWPVLSEGLLIFYWHKSLASILSSAGFHFSSFYVWVDCVLQGWSDWWVSSTHSRLCIAELLSNNDYNAFVNIINYEYWRSNLCYYNPPKTFGSTFALFKLNIVELVRKSA